MFNFCLFVQVVGMHYLTHHIWNDKSIMSGLNDLNNLRFVRFRKDIEWSPWNCILLTEEESKIHLCIKNVDEFYDKNFLERIKHKHDTARNFFRPLIINNSQIYQTEPWYNLKEFDKKVKIVKDKTEFTQYNHFNYIIRKKNSKVNLH